MIIESRSHNYSLRSSCSVTSPSYDDIGEGRKEMSREERAVEEIFFLVATKRLYKGM